MGLPGAGKSTIAPLVAQHLDASWCDLDQRIEAAAGLPIAEIFKQDGESGFRAAERAAMLSALNEPPQVIAAGAGWAAHPGNLTDADSRALLIYLSIDPARAAVRLAGSTGRPLLAGADLDERLTGLLAAREHWYRLAGIEVPASGPPDQVAAAVATAARLYGGW